MSVDPMTTEVMRRLPAGLRPNPYNLQEVVMGLSASGWLPADIFAAIMADRPQQPGHVIAAARRLATTPAPTSGEGWAYGHDDCNNPTHSPTCQICRCHKGRIDHMVPVTMPDSVRAEFRRTIGRWAMIPND